MARRHAWLPCIALIAAGAAPATGPSTAPSTESLIDRLNDADPAARREAFDALARLGPAAAPTLRKALHDDRPAVSTAAASLLLRSVWVDRSDPASARNLLWGYGNWPAEGRAEVLGKVLQLGVSGAAKAAVRVAALDPADDVAWAVFADFTPNAEAEAAIAALDPAARPAALTVALARALLARNDLAALPLIRGVIKAEHARPTADPSQLAAAVRVLADAESRQGDPGVAAVHLRQTLAGHVEPGDRIELTDELLAVQAVHGPLPGLADDLKRADGAPESHADYVLSRLARQAGLPTAAASLLGSAGRERTNESDVDRGARLLDAAVWLRKNGDRDAACRTYEALAALDTEPNRGRVVDAYIGLAALHEQAGRYGLAGDAMQRLLAHENGQMGQNRNNVSELWTIEDQQAKSYYYFLLDAKGRGDAAAVAKQVHNLIASGSTDNTVFLDALPHLEASAKPEQIDAYFDRVFERSKQRLTDYPDQPVWFNDLAWLCARSGRKLPEAVGWAERAVAAAPDTAAFLDTLAEAKFRTGHAKEAADLEAKAVAQHPDEEAFMQKQLDRFRRVAATQP